MSKPPSATPSTVPNFDHSGLTLRTRNRFSALPSASGPAMRVRRTLIFVFASWQSVQYMTLFVVHGAMRLGTRVFWVQTGGYDTHAAQAPNQAGGSYNTLMATLNDGLFAFYQDLLNQGLLADTLILQFSEFGRRVKENDSKGTDHGAAARAADPQAQIVLGGLVHWQKSGWFSALLNLIGTDPTAIENHYFMDKVAVHNYFWAWQTFGYLYPDRTQLDAHGLNEVELWLTETGVPVCGEGAFPACNDPQNRWYRAAPDEQAAYLIQSAAYAAWLKTEAYVWFQLFDDCGNQCGVDAYGLVRNDNTPRLAYQTYPLVNAQLTNVQPYWRDRRTITVHDAVVLRVGDPGTLRYTINGIAGRPLGRPAEAVTVTIAPASFRQFLAR